MADIPEVLPTDPSELLATGRRHLAVKDYSNAVTCLGKACQLLAEKFGQQADECGEAYFWYGRSLLGLAREESGVLGDGIPGGEENQEDEEEEEDGGGDEENNDEADKENEDKTEKSADAKEESDSKETSKDAESDDKNESEAKEDSMQVDSNQASSSENNEPGPSSSTAGPSSSADGEATDNPDEDDIENLQLAWEIFELARDVFLKRGERGKKELAEVYLHLGEVSLESETYDKAILDMGKSLELFVELYNSDDRRIAETHYQIGLAHSLSNGFDEAVEHFKSAANILETRIKNLQAPAAKDDPNVKKNLNSDPFYSIEGEIKEITELLPEIKEKIQDMIDYKAEAIKSVKETLGLNGDSAKENGSSSGSSNKKATDISHLIKRKRNPDEAPSDECSAAKKAAI